MKMTTVKELIDQLSNFDPNAVVLYAYNEYGRTGIHVGIVEEVVCVDSNGEICVTTDDNVASSQEKYIDMLNNELTDIFANSIRKPAIKLYSE